MQRSSPRRPLRSTGKWGIEPWTGTSSGSGWSTPSSPLTDRTFVIVEVTGTRVYAQFSAGPGYLAAQAVGDQFLPDAARLDAAGRAAMTAAGWTAPTPADPNWAIQLTLPALTAEYASVADACLTALRDVHSAPSPDALAYQAWRERELLPDGPYTDEQVAALDPGQNPLPLPTLGLPATS
ncbi:MAG: TY-Chap domain-containing protein [Dermatophilaceae bacterium]